MTGEPEVYTTFVVPCVKCGTTIRILEGTEQPHECRSFDLEQGESPAAYAWWQGYDHVVSRRGPQAVTVREALARALHNNGTCQDSAEEMCEDLADRLLESGAVVDARTLAADGEFVSRMTRTWAGDAWPHRPTNVQRADLTRAKHWLAALADTLTRGS